MLWLLCGASIACYVYLSILSLRGNVLTDFHIYYEALGRAARGEQVYDIASPMPFLYPPFFLFLVWPLHWLRESAAMSVWLYAQSVLLVVSLAALLAGQRQHARPLLPWAIVLAGVYSPIALNNLYGQTNVLCLLLLSVFALGYGRSIENHRSGRVWEIVAALALSVAINIRILPLALLAMAAIERRYRLVVWAVGFSAAEALSSAALVGPATLWQYFTSYVWQLRGHENMREISLLALAERIMPGAVGLALYAIAVGLSLAIFLFLVYRPMRRIEPSAGLHLAFVITSMVLFAPLLEYHHYVILLVPYVAVLAYLARQGNLTVARALPVFCSWAIVSSANQMSHYAMGAVAFLALLGAAILWGYVVWLVAASCQHEAKQS
ncbi:DUF2029 domain-containing protein [Candidatus Sumerlaeota bacterium]|nr:DUF2029 domain-containing protein [Candidatus Sumerlaeota bacterium]